MKSRKLLRLLPPLLVFAAFALESGQPVGAQSTPTSTGASHPKRHRVTPAERKAAAARAQAARKAAATSTSAAARTAAAAATASSLSGGPDYFGVFPNYANSPLPVLNDPLNCPAPAYCGIRKFVDALPNLPIAQPDACTFSGQAADCYEIHLREYTQQMHSDLPSTRLRGYVQVKNGLDVQAISYLGPVIVATTGKPVRVKFVNELPTGLGGNLFIPTDTTYMGAGEGPVAGESYTQNRATLHLHGGTTPWISDGTPHQWTTPAGEATSYPTGVSVYNVPDMDGGNEPQGTLSFFYSNQQSARLMFYHDHAYGITRLNVYAGEAAGYLLTDSVEQGLIGNGTLPGVGTPLVIQDRTFVPDNTRPFTNLVGSFGSQLEAQDPTWDTSAWGGPGSLWFPHVYMPNQNPGDLSGANAMGRWDYGPWFWPPFTGLTFGPVANPYIATEPNAPQIPGTPNPSGVPEGFMDTPIVNGMAYPYLDVPAGPVRFRILNASNDRFLNLSLFLADPAVTTLDSRANTEVKMVPFNSSQNTAAPFPTSWYDASVPNPFDDRVGGVPDPATRGPALIQIGTEGGFLPGPVLIKNQPVNYVMNKRDITVGNVKEKALFLGPAERADVIVDFSKFAGKTLILYNDAPAPVPAADPRLDYFTGDPDQTDTGGAPGTIAGFGPNTRTIMQIKVGTGPNSTAPVDDYNPATLGALQTALPAAFAASQDTIIVPQAPYNAAYNATFPGGASAYVKIQDTTFSFTPINASAAVTAQLQPKSIIENFTMDYGRMNALLGVEIPNTNITNQTSIPQGYVDPPTEVVKFSDGAFVGTSQGTLADGTQIWKITHNGVDTHAMHFHMFNVQLVNRVGWDGAIKPPDANELGWKDTVRTNPLEDIVVALRPIRLTNVPFKLPNSVRPLDVTRPLGSQMGFTNVDPAGNPVTVTNEMTNFGWEYVWHCHLLGHEENDMMRAMPLAVPPETPSNLVATVTGTGANRSVGLAWVDNSLNATSFTLQRATDGAFATNLLTTPLANVTTFVDPIGNTNLTYFYRVFASNTVGSTVPGYPQVTVDSAFSNTASTAAGTPALGVAPTALAFASPLNITSSAQGVTVTNTGTAPLTINSITRGGTNPGQFAHSSTCVSPLAAGASCTVSVTFTPTAASPLTKSALLNVNVAAPAVSQSVTLTGSVVVPTFTLTPASLSFSSLLNVTSAAQALIVQNTGTAPLTISSVTRGGPNANQFAQANNCPASLAGGASCQISVTFRPTTASPLTKNASLNVNVAAPATSRSSALTGTIAVPTFTLTPASLAFGSWSVAGGPTAAKPVTVANTGSVPLTISGIARGGTNPGQFAITHNCPTAAGSSLAAGASCVVNVTFNPSSAGSKNATLNVNVAAPAASKSATLSGTGTLP